MQQRLACLFCMLFVLSALPLIGAEQEQSAVPIAWGSAGDFTIVSPADQWIAFSTNLTNTANASIVLYPSLSGETSWGVDTSTISVEGTLIANGSSFELAAGELVEIDMLVYIPPVINGSPLGDIAYPFQLMLSDATGASTTWNYSIRLLAVHAITIDSITRLEAIDPAGVIRHSIDFRNIGNVYNGFEISISPLDESGIEVSTPEPRRFSYEGWNATVHNYAAAGALSPNESVTIELAINAPYLAAADISTNLTIVSNQGGLRESLTFSNSIELQHGHSVALDADGCTTLQRDSNCTYEVIVTNVGNYDEQPGIVECWSSSDWVGLSTSTATTQTQSSFEIELQNPLSPGQSAAQTFAVGVAEVVDAQQQATVACAYTAAEVWSSASIDVEMAVLLEWVVIDNGSSVNDGRLDYWLEVQNIGNRAEDFEASISVSHDTEHGLELPMNATWDANASRIRSFSVEKVPQQAIVLVKGWMNLPAAAVESDDIWLEITLSSPSDSLTETWRTTTAVAGVGHDAVVEDEQEGLSAGVLSAINTFNEFGFTTLASVFAVLLIIWAVRRRISQRERPQNAEPSVIDDWMSKFFRRSRVQPDLKSPEVSKTEFKHLFAQSGGGKPVEQPKSIEKNVVNVASNIIDQAEEVRAQGEMNAIVDDLLDDLDEDPLDL